MSDGNKSRDLSPQASIEKTTPQKVSARNIKIRRSPTATLAPPAEVGERGKGGDLPPRTVSNSEFIQAMFPSVPERASALALAKAGDPSGGDWTGFDASHVEGRCRPTTNNYVNCATFYRGEDGSLRAQESRAAAYHLFVLDDVGTKTALAALPDVEPTFMLKTSPGNYQVGYRLKTPVTDLSAVKKAQKLVFRAGLGDKGAGGIVRWVRLPKGSNGKPQHRDALGQPFPCELVDWNPGISYELDDLVEQLAPRSRPVQEPRGLAALASREPQLAHPTISLDVFRPALPENPVVSALKAAGLYKGETAPGRHDVTCPWVDEHTDKLDDGACFFEPSRDHPLGGFKCHHSHGDRYRLGALLERLELTRRDVHNKPCIRIVEGELQTMVDAAQVVLAETGEFFQAGGLIMKVAVDGATGRAFLVPQTDADLTLALSSAADWERYESKNGVAGWRRCNPLPTCIRLLVQGQTYANLPLLRGIARQPMIDPEGRLVSAAGYEPNSQLYCAFDPSKFDRPEPTQDNAHTALGRLSYLLREFHFASSRDRAAALAAIFTAVLRPAIGRAPAFHVRAPSPGSGKSLLCDVIARFAGPGEPAKVSYPRTDEEATKVILAALLQAPAVLDFDDMTIDWRPFGAINRLLTSASMTDRILGASKMATVGTDTLVLGSGNNTGPTGDLNRRVLVIDLDPQEESPATLSYEGNPLGEMEANREAYVADALLIVEAWVAAGRPRADLCPLATYGGAWTDYCRQPLVWLGLVDPAEGLIQQLRDDPDTAALGAFLQVWHAQLGAKPVSVRALLRDPPDDLAEAIEDLPSLEGRATNPGRFGYFLKRNAGRPVAGLRLEKAESRERNAWKVVRVAPAATEAQATPEPPLLPPLPPSTDPRPPNNNDE